jgi:hypothetical protein
MLTMYGKRERALAFQPYVWGTKQTIDEALSEQGEKQLVPLGLGDDYQLFRDEYDQPSNATPYTTAIPQYWVEIHDPSVLLYGETYEK